MRSLYLPRCSTVVLALVVSAILGFVVPSWGLTLEEAKAQGLVGEQPNGYLGVVQSGAAPAVQALADDINQKRRSTYEDIARRNATSLEAVEMLAGKTAIEHTKPGYFIRRPSGEWLQK